MEEFMSHRLVVAVMLGALALAPGFAGAQEHGGSLEELVAETAQTKAEHEALAKHYSEQAAAARSLASRHQAMGRAYLGGKSGNKQAFSNHCKRVSEQQEGMAKEFEALAKLHEEEAKKAQ
jgi:hypothetical protein